MSDCNPVLVIEGVQTCLPTYLAYTFYEGSKLDIVNTYAASVCGTVMFAIAYLVLEAYSLWKIKEKSSSCDPGGDQGLSVTKALVYTPVKAC